MVAKPPPYDHTERAPLPPPPPYAAVTSQCHSTAQGDTAHGATAHGATAHGATAPPPPYGANGS